MELVMEKVGALLQPYSAQLELLMMLLCYLKLLRSLRVVFPLRKRHFWECISVKSLLGGLIHSMLGIRLSQLTGDPVMWHFSIASLMLHSLVLLILYRNGSSTHKSDIARWFLMVIAIGFLCLLCCIFLKDPVHVKCFLSLARTGTSAVLILMGLVWGSGAWLGLLLSFLLTMSKLLYALSTFNTLKSQECLFVLSFVMLRITYELLVERPADLDEESESLTRLYSLFAKHEPTWRPHSG